MMVMYLILWGFMSVVLLISKNISVGEMYIGACIMIAAEYIEAVIERQEVKDV